MVVNLKMRLFFYFTEKPTFEGHRAISLQLRVKVAWVILDSDSYYCIFINLTHMMALQSSGKWKSFPLSQVLTSSMTEQMCLTHWVMACGVPEIVTALSVESGSMSPATCTWAPVVFQFQWHSRRKKVLVKNTIIIKTHRPLQVDGGGDYWKC